MCVHACAWVCVCVCVRADRQLSSAGCLEWGGVSGKGAADEKEERMDDVLRF